MISEDETDIKINERRQDGNAHMWTTQEIERVSLIVASRVRREMEEAIEMERKSHAATWNRIELLLDRERVKEKRREKFRATVIGQCVVLCAALLSGVGYWVLRVIWERLKNDP